VDADAEAVRRLGDVVDPERAHLREPAAGQAAEEYDRPVVRRHGVGELAQLLRAQPLRLALGRALGERDRAGDVDGDSPVADGVVENEADDGQDSPPGGRR